MCVKDKPVDSACLHLYVGHGKYGVCVGCVCVCVCFVFLFCFLFLFLKKKTGIWLNADLLLTESFCMTAIDHDSVLLKHYVLGICYTLYRQLAIPYALI